MGGFMNIDKNCHPNIYIYIYTHIYTGLFYGKKKPHYYQKNPFIKLDFYVIQKIPLLINSEFFLEIWSTMSNNKLF